MSAAAARRPEDPLNATERTIVRAGVGRTAYGPTLARTGASRLAHAAAALGRLLVRGPDPARRVTTD